VLTPKGQNRSEVNAGLRLGNFQLVDRPTSRPNEIMVTTIQKFKGLEQKVVIITELDSSVHFDFEKIMYIGCSRARTHLVLIHHVDQTI